MAPTNIWLALIAAVSGVCLLAGLQFISFSDSPSLSLLENAVKVKSTKFADERKSELLTKMRALLQVFMFSSWKSGYLI